MNIVGNSSVSQDIRRFTEQQNGHRVTFQWLPALSSSLLYTKRIDQAVEIYRRALYGHIARSNVNASEVTELRTEVWCDAEGFHIEAVAKDELGNEYRQNGPGSNEGV